MPLITGQQIRAAQQNPRIQSYIDVPGFYVRRGSYMVNRDNPAARFSVKSFLNTQRAATQRQYERGKTQKVQEAAHVAERVQGWHDVYLPPGSTLQDVKDYVRGLLPNQKVWVVAHGRRYEDEPEMWLTILSNTPVREFSTPMRSYQLAQENAAFKYVDQYLIRIKDQG